MAPPRRKVLETVEETLTPPNQLTASQQIARVTKATGNNVYLVELPSKESILVELSARFRSTIWMKRGSYVLVDFDAIQDRDNKLKGEIVNIVRDEKQWRKEPYWPKDFVKQPIVQSDDDDDDEEESRVGKMPSSDEEDA